MQSSLPNFSWYDAHVSKYDATFLRCFSNSESLLMNTFDLCLSVFLGSAIEHEQQPWHTKISFPSKQICLYSVESLV